MFKTSLPFLAWGAPGSCPRGCGPALVGRCIWAETEAYRHHARVPAAALPQTHQKHTLYGGGGGALRESQWR